MLPKVSIIIPVYNSERFLNKALTHVLKQTYQNIEVIVVDDSSTDKSYEIAKSFASDACKVVKQPNAGAAVARNTGLQHATGQYIQFLDADDFLSENKIEKQVEVLQVHKNKMAVCNYVEFFDESEIPDRMGQIKQQGFIYSTDNPAEFLLNLFGAYGSSNFIQTNCWLTPRNIIDKTGGWREYRCPDDDGEFFARALIASEGVVYVPGVFNFYRRTATGRTLSGNSQKKYLQNTLLTIDLKHSYLLGKCNPMALNKAIATLYHRFAVYAYPQHKVFSQIAYNRYRSFGIKLAPPKLGGKMIELIKRWLGWKATRLIKYYLQESTKGNPNSKKMIER